MFRSVPVVASKGVGGGKIHAEFLSDTGRLRVIGGVTVRAEWFPPYSWFAIASVSGHTAAGHAARRDRPAKAHRKLHTLARSAGSVNRAVSTTGDCAFQLKIGQALLVQRCREFSI
jgi:hypothetical protein